MRAPEADAFCTLAYLYIVDVDGLDDSPGRHTFKSTIMGQRGPYIPYPSHSALSYLGPNCYMLLLDCRCVRRYVFRN